MNSAGHRILAITANWRTCHGFDHAHPGLRDRIVRQAKQRRFDLNQATGQAGSGVDMGSG
jgi:hypothetical protein